MSNSTLTWLSIALVLASEIAYAAYFFTKMHGDRMDHYLAINSAILCFGILASAYHKRNLFGILEHALLMTSMIFNKTTYVSLYFTTKLVMSFLAFLISLLDEHNKKRFVADFFIPTGSLVNFKAGSLIGEIFHSKSEPLEAQDWHEKTALQSLYNLSFSRFLRPITLKAIHWEGLLLLSWFIMAVPDFGLTKEFPFLHVRMDIVLSLFVSLNMDSGDPRPSHPYTPAAWRSVAMEFAWFILLQAAFFGAKRIPLPTNIPAIEFVIFATSTLACLLILKALLPTLLFGAKSKIERLKWLKSSVAEQQQRLNAQEEEVEEEIMQETAGGEVKRVASKKAAAKLSSPATSRRHTHAHKIKG